MARIRHWRMPWEGRGGGEFEKCMKQKKKPKKKHKVKRYPSYDKGLGFETHLIQWVHAVDLKESLMNLGKGSPKMSLTKQQNNRKTEKTSSVSLLTFPLFLLQTMWLKWLKTYTIRRYDDAFEHIPIKLAAYSQVLNEKTEMSTKSQMGPKINT